MGKMTVYHGSYTTKVVPEIIKGKNTKDFGPGFYCTVIREQAERWAKRYDTPVVNIYTVRMNTSLKILEFKEMTEKWLDFIIACRHGVPHDYDLVIGAMANDQIYNYIADYIEPNRREIPGLSKIRQIVFQNIDQAICLSSERTIRYLEDNGNKIDPMTIKTYEFYGGKL